MSCTHRPIQVDTSIVGTEVGRGPLLSDGSLLAVHDASHWFAVTAAFLALWSCWEVLRTLGEEKS